MWKVFQIYKKKSGKSRSLESNQSKEMKIADPILLGRFMRDNEKYSISQAPQHRLKRYSTISSKCIGVINPEEPEKSTEMKSGRHFTVFCDYKNPGKSRSLILDLTYTCTKCHISCVSIHHLDMISKVMRNMLLQLQLRALWSICNKYVFILFFIFIIYS